MKINVLLVFLLFSTGIAAQTYPVSALESRFLEVNATILSKKYDIEKAEAAIQQARYWQNPSFSISEVNLWKNSSSETLPHLIGNYGAYQQFAFELEQLIETAGKRQKRVDIRKTEKEVAQIEFIELLRALTKEFRTTIHQLNIQQHQLLQLISFVELYESMALQYQKQSAVNNVSKADYLRIKSELSNVENELIQLQSAQNATLHQLRVLTQLNDLTVDQILFDKDQFNLLSKVGLDVKSSVLKNSLALKKQELELEHAHKALKLEKAEKTPDLNLQANYDRGGNMMRDFVGLGVSIDLPVFNRNKGNIKAAALTIEQEKMNKNAIEIELTNNIERLVVQLAGYEKALNRWRIDETDDHEAMLNNYKKHLQTKQVTLIEFIDFTRSFMEARNAYFSLLTQYYETFEEINYITGQAL
ncbi:TolC family protein [Gynurincola endophyticus]|uniref:TolC family protein n=1 Tax=Gynurincola endophyticus TaxID=2479004 RepID=UPI000F8E73E7|nr:TolC family protein [Gynurincola endophyticus]